MQTGIINLVTCCIVIFDGLNPHLFFLKLLSSLYLLSMLVHFLSPLVSMVVFKCFLLKMLLSPANFLLVASGRFIHQLLRYIEIHSCLALFQRFSLIFFGCQLDHFRLLGSSIISTCSSTVLLKTLGN